ncbi:DUF3471 domain-containing protein [Hymenobacter siberiensis]|jgi:hypothetical protein|uniref:DUF3471 domain-containing protein n=1 Tax=Hymenobacter siberiensis TaxID=2848396 RepID=UPI001C1E8AA3|nr:DUF3471 domain-containing protein [Hymenobacter siberiensis]MBU6123436.1 DUF3471 domain-containing protein [Hymenobacter siberiensis]
MKAYSIDLRERVVAACALPGVRIYQVAARSPRLVGQVLPYRGNTRVIRWKDRSIPTDEFATFNLDAQGRATSLKLNNLVYVPGTAYDFQDLDLQRVPETAAVKQKTVLPKAA